MNFDPNHAKWQCCCCHLASGMRIVAGVEIFASTIASILIIASICIARPFTITSTLLAFTLLITCIMIIAADIILCYAIGRNRETFMYPNLVMRGWCVLLVQVLGVSAVIQPSLAQHSDGDVPPVTPLVLLVFVMIFVSIAILYTIYLVVHCIRYVHGARRLEEREERRASITLAPHLVGLMLESSEAETNSGLQ